MFRRVIVGLIATVALAGGYWLFWQSPWLTVKKTTVTVTAPVAGLGTWKDPGLAKRVRDALPDVTGLHLVSVDAAQLSRKADAVRGVARVEIRRGWPDAVVVVITPAQPVAYVRQSKSAAPRPSVSASSAVSSEPTAKPVVRYALIDARGTVVDVRVTKPRQWPLLATKVSSPGGRAAIEVLMDLPKWLRAKVVEIKSQRQSSSDTVQFTLRSGRVIVWGSAENGERKADVLRTMVRFDGRIIDVSAPEVPVTRK
jgi:cell division protein FtsQ